MSASAGERVFDNRNGFEYGSAPKIQLAALLGFVGLSLLAGVASASVTLANLRDWYATLTPPPLAPSNSAVPAALGLLAILYVFSAVAAWLVWRRLYLLPLRRSALYLWGWQLALGAAWPAVFFGLHYLPAGLLIAAALTVVTLLTIRQFIWLDKAAGILLAPYLAWAVYASYINVGFWWLNH